MLDLDVPNGPGPFPLLIHVHEGAWRSGEKGSGIGVEQIRVRMNQLGYAFATINYRLSDTAKWPAQIRDCRAAVRFLRANAARYRLDVNRFAAWGAEAGGHLVSMMGVVEDNHFTYDDPSLGNPDVSGRLQAVIAWNGPTDLGTMDIDTSPACQNPVIHRAPESPESQLVGCSVGLCPENHWDASPFWRASRDDPPFLFIHGTNDCVVPPGQSRRLQESFLTIGRIATRRLIPGAGHGGFQFTRSEVLDLFETFLNRVFRPELPSVYSSADYNFLRAASGQALSVFGEGLADSTTVAPVADLPTELGGTTVEFIGVDAVRRRAGLYFVSPGQVNFRVPEDMPQGDADVRLRRGNRILQQDRIAIRDSAPTLFSSDGTGARWAAGQAVYNDGRWHPLFEDGQPRSVRLTGASGPIFLVLYGTGFGKANHSEVVVYVRDAPARISYAGPQGQIPGLDQYNVELPLDLFGRGEMEVAISVAGSPSNPVRVRID